MAKRVEDAGHGGRDPGAVANGNIEKNYTLEAALYVNRRLLEHGIDDECTRYKDETLDETPRVAKVKKYKKCNSHHFNGGGGSGVEVIVSIYSDKKYANYLIEEFRAAGYPVRPTPIFTKTGTDGRDYYFMHRRTGACETTIIEYDFVNGPQSEKIKDQKYREGMYECVVRAVCRDEGVAYKPLLQTTLKGADNVADIKYIYTGGYIGQALEDVHAYLFRTGHNFDCKRGSDGSIVFLIGRFDTSQANFKDCEAFLKKGGHTYKLLTSEEAAKFR